MADIAESLVTSEDTPEVQKQAENMGWIPPSRFKGDPERFVDASLYIKRGEEVLPIVKEQNRRLHTEIAELRNQHQQTTRALQAAQDAIAGIEERHTIDTQKQVAAARQQLVAQLANASEAGDHTGVAQLTDKLTQLNATVEQPKPVVKTAEPAVYVPPPEMVAWNAENTWFGTDKRRTAVALAAAQELRDAGDPGVGRAFYDKVAAEVAATFDAPVTRTDKVEGSRGGADSGEGGSRGGKKGYSALPVDAKQACDAEAKKFSGEGKRYKTVADWRSRYAEIYFGE